MNCAFPIKPRQMTDTVGMSDEPCTDTNPDQIAALRAIHATDDPIQRAAMVAEYNQNYGEEAKCR